MNVHFFRRKARARRAVCAVLGAWSVLSTLPVSVLALPQGGSVGGGNVSWQTVGNTMTVNQGSNRAIINWNSFSIGGMETVQFAQPSSKAAILNRVTGPYSSEIFGSLLANGNVYLINPNGILFGAGSRINVGGLVASTFDMSDEDFNAGRLNFARALNSGGKVINQGEITAGAFAYLLGSGVENSGTIKAPAVALAAGREKIVIDRTASGGEIRLRVDADMSAISFTEFDDPAAMPNVINEGAVDASGVTGGQVAMQGVNVVQAGTVNADGMQGDGGRIDLLGDRLVALGGESVTTANAGLDGNGGRIEIIAEGFAGIYEGAAIAARGGSRSGDGGFVETSGRQSFLIDAVPDVGAVNGRGGEWLIDPYNITIVTVGDHDWTWMGNDLLAIGNGAEIKVSDILSGLQNGNVTILTGSGGLQTGDITVDADIGFSGTLYAGRTLTLTAANDINLNAHIIAGANNTLGLTAGGDVTQLAGKNIQLGNVALDVKGDVTLESADNRIGTVRGTVGGDADGGNLSIVNGVALNLGGLTVENGTTTLTVNGNVTGNAANTIADLTVTTLNNGNVTLDHTGNDFGEVTANAGAGTLTFTDANGIILRDMDGSALTVSALNGSITQKGSTRVNILSGDTVLTATDQITLFNEGNDFGGPVDAAAKGVQLRDKNDIELDVVAAGEDGLIVQTDNGAITQTAVGNVNVVGETELTARNTDGSSADIILDNGANDFQDAVHADGRNIELVDANDILLGLVKADGTLDVTALGGGIAQTTDGVTAQGETTLKALEDIILGEDVNDFIDGPVNADGVNIVLTDANGILLGRADAGGTLDVTALSTGDITQTDDGVVAVGETTLTAEENAITLASENNDFQGTVNAFGELVTLTDGADGISIGIIKGLADPNDVTAADTVIITALNGGGITDAQADTVTHDATTGLAENGGRTANIIAENLLLDAVGDIGAAGNPLDISVDTLAARSENGSVWLYETDALTVGTVNGVSGIAAAQHIKLETIDGMLTVREVVTSTGGDILLAANGVGFDADVVINAAVEATDGNVTVLAADDVEQNTDGILTAGQMIDVEAQGGSITMVDGVSATAAGNIRYLAARSATITGLNGANVRVEATSGSIRDAGDTLADVTADTAQLVAGRFVGGRGRTESDDNAQALDTAVGTLAAQAGRGVYMQNSGGALEIGDVAAIDVTRVALDSTTETIGGAELVGVSAGRNAKIVNDDGDFTISSAVTAGDDILLRADNGALDVNADLTAGDLVTLVGNGISLNAEIAAGGDVAINTTGDLSLMPGSIVGGENIFLTVTGDIALDQLTARDAVIIIAGGSVTDAGLDETANITARRTYLEAGGSIGSGSGAQSDDNLEAIDLAVDNVEAYAADGIYLQSQGAVTVGGVLGTGTPIELSYARFDSGTTTLDEQALGLPPAMGLTADDGVVKLKAGGSLTVDQTVDATKDILLMTTAGDITLNAALTAGEAVTLIAANDLAQNADITAGGDIYVEAGGNLTTVPGQLIHVGGNIHYRAAGDMAVGQIDADGLVSIVAGGSITDANNDQNANITAQRIRLEAGGSIGSAVDVENAALDIESGSVEVLAGGDAHLRSENTITVGGVGEVQIDYARFASGTSVKTDADLEGITVGGDLTLTSVNGDITQLGDGRVVVGGDTVLTARNGDVLLENANNNFVGQVDATATDVYIRDANDLLAGHIHATDGGHVRITAGRDILGNGARPNVTAGTAEFYAGQDIGNPLYLDVDRIDEARAGRSINMVEISGDMRILRQVFGGGNVRLNVLSGGIRDVDGDGYVHPRFVTPGNADIFAGREMYLTADFVGTLIEPVELISRRMMYPDSHLPSEDGQGTYPWIVINGQVGRGPQDIRVALRDASVPGLVIYNGQVVSGPWWAVQQFQLVQRSLSERWQANMLDSGIVKLPWFLHPDMSLLSRGALRDDLRTPEELEITGAEETVSEGEPRLTTIGIPVSMIGLGIEK